MDLAVSYEFMCMCCEPCVRVHSNVRHSTFMKVQTHNQPPQQRRNQLQKNVCPSFLPLANLFYSHTNTKTCLPNFLSRCFFFSALRCVFLLIGNVEFLVSIPDFLLLWLGCADFVLCPVIGAAFLSSCIILKPGWCFELSMVPQFSFLIARPFLVDAWLGFFISAMRASFGLAYSLSLCCLRFAVSSFLPCSPFTGCGDSWISANGGSCFIVFLSTVCVCLLDQRPSACSPLLLLPLFFLITLLAPIRLDSFLLPSVFLSPSSFSWNNWLLNLINFY